MTEACSDCSICIESLLGGESLIGVCIPCGHCFHERCFHDWSRSKLSKSRTVKCPNCNLHVKQFIKTFIAQKVEPPNNNNNNTTSNNDNNNKITLAKNSTTLNDGECQKQQQLQECSLPTLWAMIRLLKKELKTIRSERRCLDKTGLIHLERHLLEVCKQFNDFDAMFNSNFKTENDIEAVKECKAMLLDEAKLFREALNKERTKIAKLKQMKTAPTETTQNDDNNDNRHHETTDFSTVLDTLKKNPSMIEHNPHLLLSMEQLQRDLLPDATNKKSLKTPERQLLMNEKKSVKKRKSIRHSPNIGGSIQRLHRDLCFPRRRSKQNSNYINPEK